MHCGSSSHNTSDPQENQKAAMGCVLACYLANSRADPEDREELDRFQKKRLTGWLQVGEWWLQSEESFARRNSFVGFAPEHVLTMNRVNRGLETLPISEVVTGTGRLSAFEDFTKRTLSAIAGLWAKLLYVTGLRLPDGKYEHWGHGRVHGEQNSQLALARIHSGLYLEVLRTPLRDLMQEWERSETATEELPLKAAKLIVPSDLQGGSPRHFNSIALAFHLLNVDRAASTRSNA
jgi:hypothetical protein